MGSGLSMASVNKIKELANAREYSLALELVDLQDLSKSLNPQFLRLCAEIFIQCGRMVDARKALIMGHRLGPASKRIMYTFVDLYLRMGYFELAKQYYDMYMFDAVESDRETKQLQYMWKKHEGVACEELEELISGYAHTMDYDWSYELFLLYCKQGKETEKQTIADLYIASFRNSENSERIEEIVAGKLSVDSCFDIYAGTACEDDDPQYEALRAEEQQLLEEDDLRLHPKEAEITVMYEDSLHPAQSEKKVQRLLKRQEREQEKKEKKEKKAQEKAERSVEDGEQLPSEEDGKVGFLKKLFRNKDEELPIEEDTVAESEEPVTSEETVAEPEEPVTSEETVAEPEETVTSEETAAEPEEPVTSEETVAEPEEITASEDTSEQEEKTDEKMESEEAEKPTFTFQTMELEDDFAEEYQVDDFSTIPEDDFGEMLEYETEEITAEQADDFDFDEKTEIEKIAEEIAEEAMKKETEEPESEVDEAEAAEETEIEVVAEEVEETEVLEPEPMEEPELQEEPETAEEAEIEEVSEEAEIEEVAEEDEESEVLEPEPMEEPEPQEELEVAEEAEIEAVSEEAEIEDVTEEVGETETEEEPVDFASVVAPFTTKPPKKKLDFPVFKSSLFPDYHKEIKMVENNFDSIIEEANDKMSENMKKEEEMQREAAALLASLGISLDDTPSAPKTKTEPVEIKGPSRDEIKASLKIDSEKKQTLKKLKEYR